MKRTLVTILIALLFIPILPMVSESSTSNNLTEQEIPERSVEKSNSSNQNTSLSFVPDVDKTNRIKRTFTASSDILLNSEDIGFDAVEYEDGKVAAAFKDSMVLSTGYITGTSIILYEYPRSGFSGSIIDLTEQNKISLDSNISDFRYCNVNVISSVIAMYCGKMSADTNITIANGTQIHIERFHDLMITYDLNGTFLNYWIPTVNSTINQWGFNTRERATTNYWWHSHFSDNSIFLFIGADSANTIDFLNGSVTCPNTGECKAIAKVNINGTLESYVTFDQYDNGQSRYKQCDSSLHLSIANMSALQFKMNPDCNLHDMQGNEIIFSFIGIDHNYIGLTKNLSFIRNVPSRLCSSQSVYIDEVVILPENTFYIAHGGNDETCNEYYNWHSNNVTYNEQYWLTLGSKSPNGSINWKYSWYTNGNTPSDFRLIALSYGIVWAGPDSILGFEWSDNLVDNFISPYPGPSNSNKDFSIVLSHDGEWLDSYEGHFCSSVLESRLPITYRELESGFTCSYFYGQSDPRFNIESYSIDFDGDGRGHTADPFPFDVTQQSDIDLDGYGDNFFGNNSDDCPNEQGNSTLDRLGCLDTDGDGQSNLNDFYPTDSTQIKDSDFDGFGDSLTGTRGDNCPNVYGESNRNETYGCPDSDFDGWADTQDHFPNQSSQWMDSDLDGYGDEFNGLEGDSCPSIYGKSNEDKFGCADTDEDGWSDDGDDLPQNPTQWLDRDGDGYGDNNVQGANMIDYFPSDGTQWNDTDGDGHGDNPFGTQGDWFPNDPTRWQDSDQDGVADEDDAFPNEKSQTMDTDGDGYGDNANGSNPDAFPNDAEEWSDTDGDGIGNNADAFPFDPSQQTDSDGDGFGDNERGSGADKFPSDSTQWSDIDGDGYGDNAEGTNPDAFITDPTQWADADGDGYGDNPTGRLADAFTEDSTQWIDEDGDGLGDNQSGTNADPSLNDFDNDGYNDSIDPLPKLASPGDLDNDGVLDVNDLFPDDPREWADYDGDGEGDNADTDDDNDGWADTDEVRLGTDPFGAADVPVDSFEIVIPGTAVGLGAWDLIGMFGGIPLFMWIGFGFVTRNGRTAKYEGLLREAQTRDELEGVARKWEYSLMLRMLGPHQGIRLERLRAELDDVFEAQNQRLSSIQPQEHDQTQMVEQAMQEEQKLLPSIESSQPEITALGNPDGKGYEWYTDAQETSWYRNEGSKSEWQRFEA